MASRFTNSEKWRNPWFRRLPSPAKLVWLYLNDECDHAGIWTADYEMAGLLGLKFSRRDLDTWFTAKLIHLSTEKIFIPSFIDEQYFRGLQGRFNPSNKAHGSIIAIFRAHGINPNDYHLPMPSPFKGADSPSLGGKDTEKDTELDNVFGSTETKESKGMNQDLFGDDAPPPRPKAKKKKSAKEGISFEPITEFLELKEMFGGQIGQPVQKAWLLAFGAALVNLEIRKAYAWNAAKGFLRKDLTRFYGSWLARSRENSPRLSPPPKTEDEHPMARELRILEEQRKNDTTNQGG